MRLPAAVEISHHAWIRFVTRWPIYCGSLPSCPSRELKRLLTIATPENLGGGAVLRLLDNNMEPAAYFIAEGWRFVLDEEMTIVKTIERALVKAHSKKKNKRRPWRRP